MLKLFNIVSINNDTNKATARVLNTNFITEVKTINSTQARFRFQSDPDDRRGAKDLYIVQESRAEVVTAINRSINADAITLSVYPDNDSTQTPVATVFRAHEIIQCYPHSRSDRTKSWIEVNEKGTAVEKYLIAHYYLDVADYVYTGSSTTTSTTSTSTTTT